MRIENKIIFVTSMFLFCQNKNTKENFNFKCYANIRCQQRKNVVATFKQCDELKGPN